MIIEKKKKKKTYSKKKIKKIFLIKIKVDNKASVAIAKDENAYGKCKHIRCKIYKYIQLKIKKKKKNIKLEYVRVSDMLEDPLTKPVLILKNV